MRIDGYSSAYIPNRTTRPDASAQMDDAVRQAESRTQQQQPQVSGATETVQLDTPRAVTRPSAQLQAQHYEARQALHNPPQQYQASQALASYNKIGRASCRERV